MIGRRLGNYEIKEKIGEGGMGAVFLAHHPLIGRDAAIKVLHPEIAANKEVVSRFFTEARSVNEIKHPNIVQITDFGATEDGFYLVMELLEGETLEERIKRRGAIEQGLAAKIALQIAAALGAAHDKEIVHRDLKPENVYLTNHPDAPSFVKVLDFGIAKLLGNPLKGLHKTRTGALIGTPYYMSPEQCAGEASLDHRSDIYSLGVVVYQMLSGVVPFSSETIGKLIIEHMTARPVPLRDHNPKISGELEAVVLRMLAKAPEDRQQTMSEVRSDLVAVLSNLGQGDEAARLRPPSLSDTDASDQVLVAEALAGTTLGASSAVTVSKRDIRRPYLWGGLALGCAVTVAVVLTLVKSGEPQKASESEPPLPVAAQAPPPTPTPEPELPQVTSLASDAASPVPTKSVRVVAVPKAVVSLDGKKLGTTPLEVDVPLDGSVVVLDLGKRRYQDLEVQVSVVDVPVKRVRLLRLNQVKPPVVKVARPAEKAGPVAKEESSEKSKPAFRIKPVSDKPTPFRIRPVGQ